MGLRFHRSLSLIPGLRLNISKSGPSLSVGGKGMTFNLGRKGSKTTVGLPGTGLSYSSYESHKSGGGMKLVWIVLFIIGALLLNAALPTR